MDQEEEYYEEPTDYTQAHGKGAYYLVGYFLLVAILVYPATKLHIGMAGILYAMAGAGIVLGLIWLVIRGIKRRIASMGMSKGEWARFLWGYQTAPVIEADGQAQDFAQEVPHATRQLAETDTCHERSIATLASRPHYNESDLPNIIIEDNPMYLSDTYQPNVEGMLGATALLCGRRRSGKSNAVGVLAEELARYYTPFCLGDTEDEYSALVKPEYLPRGVMAGSMELYAEACRAGIRYIPIDREGAYEFGQSIPRDVLQVVLNLQSFAGDDEAAIIMSEIVDGMNDWEQGRPNNQRVPCMFMLDEANKWLPQNITESCITDREILYMLQRAIFGTMVRRGGKRGLGVILTTQRIAELDKRALQSIWKFLFQQGEEVDLDRYAALGLDRNDVLELQQGECFIFSPGVIGFKAMMRVRHSPHLGHTPGLSQLAAHLRHVRPLDLVTARSYTSIDADPDRQANQNEEHNTEHLQSQESGAGRQKPLTLEERGVQAWNAGHQSGRKLAAALDIGESAGNQLMNKLIAKGLITVKQKQTASND